MDSRLRGNDIGPFLCHLKIIQPLNVSIFSRLSSLSERTVLAIIAVIIFVVQFATLRTEFIYGEPYLVAQNILAGKGFVFTFPLDHRELVTCYVTPMYVFIQLAVLWLGGGVVAIKILGLVFLHCANLTIFTFFRRFRGRSTSTLIYIAVALYPPLWIYAEALEPNALNVWLLALTMLAFYDVYREPVRRRWIRLGILFGIQLWLRPDILIGMTVIGLWLLYALRKRQFVENLNRVAQVALIGIAIILPWTIRNYIVFHKLVLVSANSGYNLYVGNCFVATGEMLDKPATEESTREYMMIQEFQKTHDQVEHDELLKQLALNWIWTHPTEAFLLDLKKIYYHWWVRGEEGHHYRVEASYQKMLYQIATILIYIFGVVGLFNLKDHNLRWLFIALFTYSTLVSAIFFVQSRHRTLKVDPFLLPLAVIGVVTVSRRLSDPWRSSAR